MAVLIVIMVLLASVLSSAISIYVMMKYLDKFTGKDDLQMQIDYLKDMVNRKHEISMKFMKQVNQREIDHWNFINLYSKMW